jgi:hypothetical protein
VSIYQQQQRSSNTFIIKLHVRFQHTHCVTAAAAAAAAADDDDDDDNHQPAAGNKEL